MPDKISLRSSVRHDLSLLTENQKATASAHLREQLKSWQDWQSAPVVALFHPTIHEPDLLPLLHAEEKRFVFPCCHPDRSLTWHTAPGFMLWKRSRFGIMEPDPEIHPAVSPGGISLVLVPGLAFTESGARLGHGAGYYDRFLSSLPPRIPTAGICFSCQIMPTLPLEPHDIGVGRVFHA